MLLKLYQGVGWAMPPVARLVLARRRTRGKESRERFQERFGHPRQPRPDGSLIWLHAASVGEATSILPLVDRLLERLPDSHVMVTSGTVTSARLMDQRLPARAFHQFIPVDSPPWVRRFLRHYRPDLALWVESELWPNLITRVAGQGIPLIMINGRMSEGSFRSWRRARRAARSLMQSFALVMAQSETFADRFRQLGASRVAMPGNLKLAAPPLPADPVAVAALTKALAGRPVWVGASTHPGEEMLLEQAQEIVREKIDDALLIIVPRHPERGSEIASAYGLHGHQIGLASERSTPAAGDEIFVADTLGELGLYYRAAPIVFVGGSLVPHGGQNLIEPAQLDSAIIHGPHVTNFAEIAADLRAAGATRTVNTSEALAEEVLHLMSDPEACAARAKAAAAVAHDRAGVLDATMALLEPWLDPVAAGQDQGAETTDKGVGSDADA